MSQEIVPQESGGRAMDLFSRADAQSVINLVPTQVAAALLDAAAKEPDLFGQEERELRKKLRSDKQEPNATDNRLRLKFWNEYDRVQSDGGNMQMTNVYSGVCSKQFFYERYLTTPAKLAWLMTPPANYVAMAEEALHFGIEQLRDILEMPAFDAKGRPDIKLGELKAKIVAMLDQRVKGAVIQKNMNLNVTTNDPKVAKAVVGETMEDLQRRMKELEARERRALNLPEPAPEPRAIEAEFTRTE
jgi:hypothetical protein